MKLKNKNALLGYALILPLLLGCIIFYGIPFGMVAWFSIVKGSGSSQAIVGFESYIDLLSNRAFRIALWNTLKFLAVGLLLILVISFAIALFLKSKVGGRKKLQSLILMPYVMPIVGTVLLVDVLFSEAGLGNTLLNAVGLPVQDWLHSEWAFWVVIILYLWKNTGYSVVILLSGLVAIPEEQYLAASLDGAGRFAILKYITLPQMWYSIFFAGVFSLINAFKCFREIFLIGGTYPHESIYMLQHFINNCFEKLSYSKMAVASMILTLIISLLFVVFYRLVIRKEKFRE